MRRRVSDSSPTAGIPSYLGLRLQQRERGQKARAGLDFAARSDVEQLEEKVQALEQRLGGQPVPPGPEPADEPPDGPAAEQPVVTPADLPSSIFSEITAEPPASSRVLGRFSQLDSDEPAGVILRQVDADTYELLEAFRYRDGDTTIVVPAGWETDLVSIPRILRWFITPYGPHTLPAILRRGGSTGGSEDRPGQVRSLDARGSAADLAPRSAPSSASSAGALSGTWALDVPGPQVLEDIPKELPSRLRHLSAPGDRSHAPPTVRQYAMCQLLGI